MNAETVAKLEDIRARLTEKKSWADPESLPQGAWSNRVSHELYSLQEAQAVVKQAQVFAAAVKNAQPNAIRQSLIGLVESINHYIYEATDEGLKVADWKKIPVAANMLKTAIGKKKYKARKAKQS